MTANQTAVFDDLIGALATLKYDLDTIRTRPLFPAAFVVGGFIFGVHGGDLVPVPA